LGDPERLKAYDEICINGQLTKEDIAEEIQRRFDAAWNSDFNKGRTEADLETEF